MNYEKIYYDPSHEAGYAGAHNLIRVSAKGRAPANAKERARINEWLSNQDSYTLHRPIKRKFPRLSYNVSNMDDYWEIDLLQMTTLKEYNDDYSYILVVIDVLSKYAWVEILRDKSATTVATAFEKILKRANGRIPVCVQSDQGKEFIGAPFQKLLKKYDISFRYARNPDIKAAVVERLNRTIRERIWRYFSYKNTKRYIDVLQNIVHAYNHTLHSGTKMRPCEVNFFNVAEARENLEKRARMQSVNRRVNKRGDVSKYKVGDHVRISRTKATFERGYEKNFSEEIFKIKRISKRQNIFTYELEDLNGDGIDGFFYNEELAKVGDARMQEQFKVERVLETKGRGKNKQVLVKWLGFPSSFNSWIKASELQSIG